MTRAGWRYKDLPALETSSKGTLQGASEGPSNTVRLWSQLALFHCPDKDLTLWFIFGFLTLEETIALNSQGYCE